MTILFSFITSIRSVRISTISISPKSAVPYFATLRLASGSQEAQRSALEAFKKQREAENAMPFIDLIKTKRWWIITMQLLIARGIHYCKSAITR